MSIHKKKRFNEVDQYNHSLLQKVYEYINSEFSSKSNRLKGPTLSVLPHTQAYILFQKAPVIITEGLQILSRLLKCIALFLRPFHY